MQSHLRSRQQPHKAFTLIEILVVLAIIGLLTAILFPIFKSTRERGYQTNCATNLRQIGVALQMYKQDEKRYPESLRDILPSSADIPDYAAGSAVTNEGGTGFLKTTKDVLVCMDDDTEEGLPRSSYGEISTDIASDSSATPPVVASNAAPASGPDVAEDPARFVWNFWGYDDDGIAYRNADRAMTDTPSSLLADSSAAYHWRNNPVKHSLSNRYAPPGTIVTHCVYHRRATARNIDNPMDLYSAPTTDTRNARDIILRVDGSVRTLDVTAFKTNGNWQNPTF